MRREIIFAVVLSAIGVLNSAPAVALTVVLAWDPPNPDEASLIKGYKLYYGQATRNYTTVIDIGLPSDSSFSLPGLENGIPYHFAITAYDSSQESSYSNEVFLPSLEVSIAGSGSGSVNSNPPGIACTADGQPGCKTTSNPNEQITLLPSPSWNSTFVGWGGACSGTSACVLRMDASKAAVANFQASASVKLDGPTPRYFSTIQAACEVPQSNSVIEAMAIDSLEHVIINRIGTISFSGGLDPQFRSTTGKTAVKSLTIRQGTFRVKNLVIR